MFQLLPTETLFQRRRAEGWLDSPYRDESQSPHGPPLVECARVVARRVQATLCRFRPVHFPGGPIRQLRLQIERQQREQF
jgi:hypothetical protein